MRIIAFAGSKGAGKDTAARYLTARNGLLRPGLFVQANFADTLKQVVELTFGFTHKELYDANLKEVVVDRWPNKCPREILQNVAELFRTMYAPDIWVRAWLRRVPLLTADCILVTDLRHVEELGALKERGAKIIFIDNPEVNKKRADGIANNDPLWTDKSEAFTEALKHAADYIVLNDSDLNTLYSRTHEAVQALYPDWQVWDELSLMTPSSKAQVL